jgi:hypothetical protein
MKKKLLALPIAMALFSVMGFAEGEKVMALEQGHAIVENQFPSGYDHQARIDVDGWNVFITGSFIYWQAMEEGLDTGLMSYNTAVLSNDSFYDYAIQMNFKYKPGFKVALGTKLGEHDNWLLSAEYTWLHLSDVKEVVYADIPDNYVIYPSWGNMPFHVDSFSIVDITAKWKLRYDMIDLEMTRPYYVGTHLVLKPFGALRGGLIKQYYDIKYPSEVGVDGGDAIAYTFETHMIQKSWMVGPRIGIDCDWIFFDYFRLIANAAAGLFYQHFTTTGNNGYTVARTLEYIMTRAFHNNVGQLTPNLEGALGLGWGSYFGEHNGWHFDLSALYEVHYFFDQNKMYQENLRVGLRSVTTPQYTEAGNLMMHGLTITARVDF